MRGRHLTLGAVLRDLRSRNGWTLKEMSERVAIPVSTLTKVEHDRLTLTYDKLQQLGARLGLRMSELFLEDDAPQSSRVLARRSIGTEQAALRVNTPNYDHYYLCTELRQKRMIPMLTKIRAKTLDEFGSLVHHAGEEFVYVVKGKVVVHTEFYDPVTLGEGEGIYIDSAMGHAYLAGDGCDEALMVGVMSSADEDLMESLMQINNDAIAERAG